MPKKLRFGYAFLAMPLAVLGLPLYMYLPAFYAQEMALGVGIVGAVLLVTRVIDMLLDPLIGRAADRYGAHHAFIYGGSAAMLGGFWALSHPIAESGIGWLGLFSLVVYVGWSSVTVPYYALSAYIGRSSLENTTLASHREFFSMLGVLGALSIPYMWGVADHPRQSLGLLSVVLAVLVPLCVMFFGLTVPKKSAPIISMVAVSRNFYTTLKANKALYTSFLLNHTANALPATLFLFYLTHVMGAAHMAGALLLVYFIFGMAGLPLWVKLSHRVGKTRAWSASIMMAVAAFSVVPFLGSADVVWFALVTMITGLSLGADMALPASIQTDCAQEGLDHSGFMFGIWAMLTKMALALAVGVGFGLLALGGFEPDAPTQSALHVLILTYAGVPIVLKLGALYAIGRMNRHKQPTNSIQTAIQ